MKIFKTYMPEIKLKFKPSPYPKCKISSALDAYTTLLEIYDDDTVDYIETAYVLFLNRNNNTIGWLKLSEGGTTATLMDPKVIFATALKCNASALILCHNHPSGKLSPSKEDIAITENVANIGSLLNINVFDHLIITRSGYLSMNEDGYL
jgi:DNA repair protein RadC